MEENEENSIEQTCEECGNSLDYDRKHAHWYCDPCGLIPEHANGYDSGYGELRGSTELGTIVTSWRGQSHQLNERGYIEERSSDDSDDTDKIIAEVSGETPHRTTFTSSGKYARKEGLERNGEDGHDLDRHRDRMWLHNRGEWGNRGKRKRSRKSKCYLVETFARMMDISKKITTQAKRLVLRLDAQPFSPMGAFSAMALVALAFVYNDYWVRRPDDVDKRLQCRDSFKDLVGQEGVDWKNTIKQANKQLRRSSKEV